MVKNEKMIENANVLSMKKIAVRVKDSANSTNKFKAKKN